MAEAARSRDLIPWFDTIQSSPRGFEPRITDKISSIVAFNLTIDFIEPYYSEKGGGSLIFKNVPSSN